MSSRKSFFCIFLPLTHKTNHRPLPCRTWAVQTIRFNVIPEQGNEACFRFPQRTWYGIAGRYDAPNRRSQSCAESGNTDSVSPFCRKADATGFRWLQGTADRRRSHKATPDDDNPRRLHIFARTIRRNRRSRPAEGWSGKRRALGCRFFPSLPE